MTRTVDEAGDTDPRARPRGPEPRSWIFVPGDKPRFLAKALTLSVDVVLLDLEDGVLPATKPLARELVSDVLQQPAGGPRRFVRVNALSTPWLSDDLDAVVVPGLEGICLTKVRGPEDILETSRQLGELERQRGLTVGRIRILAAIEDACGLLAAPAIATADPRLTGLIFGAEDFALDLGLDTHRIGAAADLLHARSSIVVAARAADISSVDGVYPDLDDEAALVADAVLARQLGFTGKSTFNPRQIDLIHSIFAPSAESLDRARRVVDAFRVAEARGDASVAVDGQLVDRPIVLRALRALGEA